MTSNSIGFYIWLSVFLQKESKLNEPVEQYCGLSFLKNMCANKFQIEQPDSYDYPYIIYVKNLPAWLLLHIPSILTSYWQPHYVRDQSLFMEGALGVYCKTHSLFRWVQIPSDLIFFCWLLIGGTARYALFSKSILSHLHTGALNKFSFHCLSV